MSEPKLFMIYLGCKPPGRHTEQHDVFFGIATSVEGLIPAMKAFWPEPDRIHMDAWREVTSVDGYRVSIALRQETNKGEQAGPQLFFVNLGGYQRNVFSEQHYIVLTVQPDRATAINSAKKTLFFKENHFDNATSHIDDKYGVDVDDIYGIEDILPAEDKRRYSVNLSLSESSVEDEVHIGYFKLN